MLAGRKPGYTRSRCSTPPYRLVPMCSGAILLYGIPKVVIGENSTFMGAEDLLRSRGVEVIVLDDQECKDLMAAFIRQHPEAWNEDIGED
jgi:creatinine deaminase